MTLGEWIDCNPIRKWIDENPERRSQALIASRIGVTPMMVSFWVRGQGTPSNHWQALGEFLGDEELEQHWQEWLTLRKEGQVDFGESDPPVA